MVHEKVKKYIETWEARCYYDGLPDESPIEIKDKVPSYKRIAMAILNNDLHLSSLGYSLPYSQYYGILKKMEIEQRPNYVKQLTLF